MPDLQTQIHRIIKDGSVVSDNWQTLDKSATSLPNGKNILFPLALWQQQAAELGNRADIGVWFDSDEQPTADIAAALQKLPLIAIHFPVFADGRGFSIARLLRERFAYTGELRAFGYVLRDQLCFMKRCGFNSFVLQEHVDMDAALASLNDFTEAYQTSVDQPQPLFRRM
jgi:uncharacterized protein (DUF934 family)